MQINSKIDDVVCINDTQLAVNADSTALRRRSDGMTTSSTESSPENQSSHLPRIFSASSPTPRDCEADRMSPQPR